MGKAEFYIEVIGRGIARYHVEEYIRGMVFLGQANRRHHQLARDALPAVLRQHADIMAIIHSLVVPSSAGVSDDYPYGQPSCSQMKP